MSDKELSVEEAKADVLKRCPDAFNDPDGDIWELALAFETWWEEPTLSDYEDPKGYLGTDWVAAARNLRSLGDGKWDQLLRLAQDVVACGTVTSWVTKNDLLEEFIPPVAAFIAAANPAVVLELLAENARLHAGQALQETSPAVAEAEDGELKLWRLGIFCQSKTHPPASTP